ncbi:MAG: hypothetical protein IPJ03_14365 [Ignavibacteriales bacterium]|nr:hypothetical protein [Ignavibacteriales bacterium]
MASISEQSFGQRYTKARGLQTYLGTIPTYAPVNPDLAIPAFTTFLDGVLTSNTDVDAKLTILQTERDTRLNLYLNSETGLIVRCAQIRDHFASTETKGKKSKNFEKAQKITQRMRGKRLGKIPPTPPGGTPAKKISTSEVSFGSVLAAGRELLEVIKSVAGYAPSNTNITVANFTSFLNSIEQKNTLIYQRLEQYDNDVEVRMEKYITLKDRVSKIKAALASQFGKNSNEYKDSLSY